MSTPRPPSTVHLRLPFRDQPHAALMVTGLFPVTEAEWDLIMAILASMKPALVTAAQEGTPDECPA